MSYQLTLKNALYLRVNQFSMKVLIEDTMFRYLMETGPHLTWSSKPRKGVKTFGGKRQHVSSFLSSFKTLSIGPTPGSEPVTFPLFSQAL